MSYCLAVAAEQTGVLVHAACFMSNHWHGVVSDPFARLPEFLERFHRLVAKAMNASLGRVENFWSSDKPSVVLLVTDRDVLDKMAYTLANPTAAGLVRSPSEWPGLVGSCFTRIVDVEMPDVFFDVEGELPDQVRLEFVRPPGFSQLDDASLARRLGEIVMRLVQQARHAARDSGKSFMGAKEVLRQPFSAAPLTSAPRHRLNPRVAAKDVDARCTALSRLMFFLREYRAAWQEWRNGRRDVTFPPGTYALRVYARVACAPVVPV